MNGCPFVMHDEASTSLMLRYLAPVLRLAVSVVGGVPSTVGLESPQPAKPAIRERFRAPSTAYLMNLFMCFSLNSNETKANFIPKNVSCGHNWKKKANRRLAEAIPKQL